jgi:hypothetical protein
MAAERKEEKKKIEERRKEKKKKKKRTGIGKYKLERQKGLEEIKKSGPNNETFK